jgi:hypothetical protein
MSNNIDLPTVHRFNTRVAQDYGLPPAILFLDISYWITRNKKRGVNLKNGKCWLYDSQESFQRRHPYLSLFQVQAALKKLEEAGLIETDCLNKTAYDHTRWYTLGLQAPHYLTQPKEKTEDSETQFLGHRHPNDSGVDTQEVASPIPIKDKIKDVSFGDHRKRRSPKRENSPLEGTDFKTKSPQEGEKRKLLPEEILDKRDHPTGRGVWMAGQWLPIYKPFADDPTCPEMVKFPAPTEEEGGAWVWKRLSDKN